MDLLDRNILNEIQWCFPLKERPFLEIALHHNISENEVMKRIHNLKQMGLIRQINAIFDTRRLGYKSALIAFAVKPEKLDYIANEITCPITYEPADQLYILECQHVISLNNLKKLKQAKCPTCQQKILDDNIRYLPQNTIYKNLYSQFFEAGHILPSIETEDQHNNSSDESESDMILTKKKQLINTYSTNLSQKDLK